MQFTKLQGAGNDYVYVNGLTETRDWAELSRRIADRHFGVGADGLIVVTTSEKAPVRMRMFNADGSEGEMCGNGIRCFAKYVLERNLVPSNGGSLDVETAAGVLSIVPHWEGRAVTGARVDMGAPILCATDVPAAKAEKIVAKARSRTPKGAPKGSHSGTPFVLLQVRGSMCTFRFLLGI